jgi:hypothetical protein
MTIVCAMADIDQVAPGEEHVGPQGAEDRQEDRQRDQQAEVLGADPAQEALDHVGLPEAGRCRWADPMVN